ncbi:DUF4919 domain-containing protein [Gilvimarinus sp. DA14]|uniref:DUF4919 domain-containing protein n=1 Tax=Gilvimarinus sp. DA14 TaxID=2956798 RepID=UPI0020B6B1CF|nr:DUF4919 domain-containing protein [Gilvimarinus sp. DA14]UTF58947.1 DUF4919 domain-containing protein [Gilvimarinus sp. DA14]
MRAIGLAVVFLLVAACSSTPTEDHSRTQADVTYHELVDSVSTHTTLPDLISLREIYVQTSYYQPYTGPELVLSQVMFEAMGTEDWDTCQRHAQTILDSNFISLSAHYAAMVCEEMLGDSDASSFHQILLDGLMEAIWSSGNGTSEAEAFFCTSTPELQAFIQIQGLEIIGQALSEGDNGRAFDIMEVKEPVTGREFTWYFDITAQWQKGLKNLSAL